MDKYVLIIGYHPAKKEIQYERLENGNSVVIRDDSKLAKYINMKGSFVLQNQGTDFFNDIADVFDGLENVALKLRTTKTDYEDFVQMVDYYNNNNIGKCNFSVVLDVELPDMQETFEKVKQWGNTVANTLKTCSNEILEINTDKDIVKQSIKDIVEKIEEERLNIEGKIEAMDDNNINLCFVGVYSAGKSALINALIGYRILPEALESKTAKMFCISSPKMSEKRSLRFEIDSVETKLDWNKEENCFEIVCGPTENHVRNEIQKLLIDNKANREFEQIRNILDFLNTKEEVSSQVIIKYPIPLDNEKIQYTIYDTPGSDSNFESHQKVLEEALSKQTQSILIFVCHPEKLEGEGNSALLNFLMSVEKNNRKTSIDIDRSIFVVNRSDGLSYDDRKGLAKNGIVKSKTDDSFQIRLSDKKLIFTAANCSNIAKARKNGVESSTEKEDDSFGDAWHDMIGSKRTGFCYKQDKCAKAENATVKLLEKCDKAFEEAKENGDETLQLAIASGIYALEEEIKTYGEKYAYATKVYAIIDSVDRALNQLIKTVNVIKKDKDTEVRQIEEKLENEKEKIVKGIEDVYKKYKSQAEELPKEDLIRLRLDSNSIGQDIIVPSKKRIDSLFDQWFNIIGHVNIDSEEKKRSILNELNNVFRDQSDGLSKSSWELHLEKRSGFITEVLKKIGEIDSLNEKDREFLGSIPELEIPMNVVPEEVIIEIIKELEDAVQVLWMKFVDRSKFKQDLEVILSKWIGIFADRYKSLYGEWLIKTFVKARVLFMKNFEIYSNLIKSLESDKETINELKGKIEKTSRWIEFRQKELNNKLWKK